MTFLKGPNYHVLMTVYPCKINTNTGLNIDRNKIDGNQLIRLFINDLQLNIRCKTDQPEYVKYCKSKQKEWALLEQLFKTKTVTV